RDQGRPIWSWVLIGILDIAAGIVAFVVPGLTAFALLMFIAAWAIVMGVLQIVSAIRIRKEIDNEWLLALSGVVSLLFGIVMIVSPGAGALAAAWTIAAYAAVFGVMLIAFAFRVRARAPHPAT